MRTLLVMNRDFTLLGELALFQSLTLTRSWTGIGSFSLTAHPRVPGASALLPGALVYPAGEPHKMMLVEGVKQTADKLTATGVPLKGLIRRRIAVPPLRLPASVWRYAAGVWAEITDAAQIAEVMQADVLQGYERPQTANEGAVWVDLRQLAAIYDWDKKAETGAVWLDLGTAQTRKKYQNFGWDRFVGSAESAYKHFAANNLADGAEAARRIDRLTIAPDLRRGSDGAWQARFDGMAELFEKIGESGLGWDIRPDTRAKRFVLNAFEGRELSEGSRVVAISLEAGNAAVVEREESVVGKITTCYAGGAGEDENRLILQEGERAAGWERFEKWAEAGSVDDADMLKLYARGQLQEGKICMSAQVLDSGACRYERDWNLGDRVRVVGSGGSMAARINEVTETHENGERKLSVVFGSAPVTVSRALRDRYGGAAR